MSSYTQAVAQRAAIVAAVEGITDVGVVLTTWEPTKNAVEFLSRYQAEVGDGREIRGVIISPATPFRVTVLRGPGFDTSGNDAALLRDTWRWQLYCFTQASTEAEKRDEALERHMDVQDALDALYEMTAYAVTPRRVGPSQMQDHGFGTIGGFGAWITDLTLEVEVDRLLTRTA